MIHLIGFGGQGKAWAPSLREANFMLQVYLRPASKSFALTQAENLNALHLHELSAQLKENDTVIFACPDRCIGEVYQTHLSSFAHPLHLILIHGYAMWSAELKPSPLHSVGLLAPKAIGPELREAIFQTRKSAGRDGRHSLKAALCLHTDSSRDDLFRKTALANLHSLAHEGLRFSVESLIPATFEQETVGDLISEQLLLCGGLFSLLEWTTQEMKAAGIPETLIHEECITELELIARMIRKNGLSKTLHAISDSAKAGAVMMRNRFVKHGLPALLHQQASEVVDKTFLKNLRDEQKWQEDLKKSFRGES